MRVSVPQLELGSFASSPILPPAGSPQATTRGADLVSAILTTLGIRPTGACTLLLTGMLPQAAPAGAAQSLAQLDSGSDASAIVFDNAAGGSTLRVAGQTLGTMTAGTPFRIAASIDGAGRVAQPGRRRISGHGRPTAA